MSSLIIIIDVETKCQETPEKRNEKKQSINLYTGTLCSNVGFFFHSVFNSVVKTNQITPSGILNRTWMKLIIIFIDCFTKFTSNSLCHHNTIKILCFKSHFLCSIVIHSSSSTRHRTIHLISSRDEHGTCFVSFCVCNEREGVSYQRW